LVYLDGARKFGWTPSLSRRRERLARLFAYGASFQAVHFDFFHSLFLRRNAGLESTSRNPQKYGFLLFPMIRHDPGCVILI